MSLDVVGHPSPLISLSLSLSPATHGGRRSIAGSSIWPRSLSFHISLPLFPTTQQRRPSSAGSSRPLLPLLLFFSLSLFPPVAHGGCWNLVSRRPCGCPHRGHRSPSAPTAHRKIKILAGCAPLWMFSLSLSSPTPLMEADDRSPDLVSRRLHRPTISPFLSSLLCTEGFLSLSLPPPLMEAGDRSPDLVSRRPDHRPSISPLSLPCCAPKDASLSPIR